MSTQKPLSQAAFERELAKAVNGDPQADASVKEFLDDVVKAYGIKGAITRSDGIEVLRGMPRPPRTDDVETP